MKLLIIKTSSLGDIVQTFPVLEYLKIKFPHAKIDWIVEEPFSDIVRAHPYIDKVICIHTKKWRNNIFSSETWKNIAHARRLLREQEYDFVFDLQSNVKSSILTLQTRSRNKVGFGFSTAHEWFSAFFVNRRYNPPEGINIRDDYLFIVQRCFNDFSLFEYKGMLLKITPEQEKTINNILNVTQLQHEKKVMVCPGSAWRNKQLTEETFVSFLKQVQSSMHCGFLFIWGSQEEKILVQKLHDQFQECSIVVDRMQLPVLQNLMGHMDLVISMDSLPLHLAGTTATPTFSVFGSSLASKFKPKGTQHQSIQGTCPYGKTFPKRCPILRTCPTGACIRNLTGKQVFEAIYHKK